MAERRVDLLILLLILAAVCAVFFPVLGNSAVPFGGADGIGGEVYGRFLAKSLEEHGQVPLWNPQFFAGLPTVDSLSFPLFYPFHALYTLLPGLESLFHHIALHLLLAGMLTYLLARDIGLARPAAGFSALAFALTGYLVTLTTSGHGGKIWTVAYLPLVLYTLRRVLREPNPQHAFAAGLVAGLQILAGHYQIVFYTWFAAGLQLLWHLSGAAPASRARSGVQVALARRLAAWFCVPAVAVGIAAAQLLPVAKYTPWSNRAETDFEYVASFSLPPAEIINFAAPEFFGHRAATGMRDYWGSLRIRGSTEYMGITVLLLALLGIGVADRKLQIWIAGGSASLILVLALAQILPLPQGLSPPISLNALASCFILATLAAAMIHWLNRLRQPITQWNAERERSEVAGLMVLIGAWSAFLMVGDHLPSFELFGRLPGFNRFRAPHSQVVLVAFAVTMLAGLGLDALLRELQRKRMVRLAVKPKKRAILPPAPGLLRSPWTAPALVVLALLGMTLVGGVVMRGPLSIVFAEYLATTRLATLVSPEYVERLYSDALGSIAVATCLWALVVALLVAAMRDWLQPRTLIGALCLLAVGELIVVDRQYIIPVDLEAAFARIVNDPMLNYVADRVARDRAAGNPTRLLSRQGDSNRINDPALLDLESTGGYHGAPMGDTWEALGSQVEGFAEAYFSLSATRYLLLPTPMDIPERFQTLASVKGREGPAIVENLRVLPRARVVYTYRVVEDRSQQQQVLASAEHNSATTVLLDVLPEVELRSQGQGRARVSSFIPNRVEIDVTSSIQGLLVLADTYYPGWRAFVDGEERSILRADHLFRAVAVPAGRSQVVFEFKPVANAVGAGISLGTVLLALGAILLGFFRARRSGENASTARAQST